MSCVYHPNRASVEICHQCDADLCESCAIHLEDGRTHCHRCNVALSVVDVRVEAAIRRLGQEARQLGLEKRWRPSYLQIVISLGAVLAVLAVGLSIYWSQSEQPRHITLDPEEPISVLFELQKALEHYALVHSRRYPVTLFDLFPRFLTDSGQNRSVLRQLNYDVDEDEGYVLRIKERARMPGKEFVATAKGIRLTGIELPGRGR